MMNGMEYQYNQLDLDIKLALFFFACNIPFRVVENYYFRDFIRALLSTNINYRIPCRQTLSTSILNTVNCEIQIRKKSLLNDTDAVLLVDGWKNTSANRKYLTFTLKTIHTDQTFLWFKDISLEREDAITQSVNIQNAIDIAYNEYNSRVFAIITDNDAKIVNAGALAKTFDDKPLIQNTCSSHSANLTIQHFVDEETLLKIREIVQTFRDPKLDCLLRDRLGGTKIKNYPDTRFCYLRNTCESIYDNLDKLRVIVDEIEDIAVKERVREAIFDEDFASKLLEIIRNLKPICVLINKCQDPKSNVADAVEMWLSLQLPTDRYDQILNERKSKAIKEVGYAANVLHHRYRGDLLNENQRRIARNFMLHHFPECIDEYDYYLNNIYQLENFADRCDDPVDFWSIQSLRFQNLGRCALKLMLIPASTAMLEGLFSSWTYIHNEYRNRLLNEKSAKLLDIYHSLKHFNIRIDNYLEPLENGILLNDDN